LIPRASRVIYSQLLTREILGMQISSIGIDVPSSGGVYRHSIWRVPPPFTFLEGVLQ
jgi:hypothetical protein